MAWLTFKLGRPGAEVEFTVNPAGMDVDESPIAGRRRNIAGDLKKSVVKSSAPTVRINSNYLSLTQRNQFASMAGYNDTLLSFMVRDDLQIVLEKNLPTDVNTVVVQNNSATRLAAALVAAGAAGSITVTGVFTTTDGSGTNYFTGGSYAEATRTITLGTPLADAAVPVYVTYTYKGWLVDMERITTRSEGGWVDRFTYDFSLVGA